MPVPADIQTERREAIRRVLERAPAATQQDLVDALTSQGFHATQSSVSRDLKGLGAVKTGKGYELPGLKTGGESEISSVADLLRNLSPAGPNLLVIKTAIGAAQRVALALDRCGWPEIVGNVGGDDTVFTATATAAAQRALLQKIHRAAGGTRQRQQFEWSDQLEPTSPAESIG
jgi:transcriptional regulator of arginine metabolism